MKINVISIFFPPEKGAASGRIFNMVKELQNRGCDVQVITAFPNYPTGKIFPGYKGLVADEVIEGVIVKRLWLYPSNSKNPLLRVISMISFSITMYLSFFFLRKRKADITIVNSPPLFTGFAGVILGRLVSKKVVVNISDIWPLSALELGAIKRGKFYSLLEWMEHKIYKKADLCLSQSADTKTHINNIFPDKDVFLYRNLARINKYNENFNVRIDSSIKFKIVYAGLLGVAQGVFRIIEAIDFKALNIELDIYGAGNETEKIKRYIEDNKDCNITYHGLISPTELEKFFPSYHASLIPLTSPIYGAFPSKIFGAMAAGVPVIFSGEGEGAEFVENYKIGYVNQSSDLKSLEQNLKKIKSLADDEYQKIKQNGINLANSDFGYSNNQDNLNSKLKSILNG